MASICARGKRRNEAFRAALPDMPEEQAKVETSRAFAYAAANHGNWFWGGVRRGPA
jgi:hypothetical protein